MSGGPAWKKEHQGGGGEYGDAGKCQTSVETAGFLPNPAHHVWAEEAAEVGYGADQGNAGGRCEAGEELAGDGVKRPIDAVDAECGDTEERHGWDRGVRGIHCDERGCCNECGDGGVKLSF